jgi:hypothetical protein
MIAPVMAAWMKQLCYGVCLGIYPGQVRALVEVTIYACERQVIKVIAAAMYSWNDVLYVNFGARQK